MDENQIDELARKLAVQAQRELFEVGDTFVNVDNLQAYFDEAIHNAIDRERGN
jgi:hypothetical protein